jgi:peptidoglycan DL-endopeptidase CwlO
MAAQRASRAAIRRAAALRPVLGRPVDATLRDTPEGTNGPAAANGPKKSDGPQKSDGPGGSNGTERDNSAERTGRSDRTRTREQARRSGSAHKGSEERAGNTRSVRSREARHTRRAVRHLRSVVTRHSPVKRQRMRLGNMNAVVAYAKSQVGKRYVSGGEGGGGFDCSGLTKRAYAQAGIRLPHSSGAQAARARSIRRSQARPGDLVVGRGHVGIYMGGGMMVDAGNHRTGVVYRKLYSGLRVERF